MVIHCKHCGAASKVDDAKMPAVPFRIGFRLLRDPRPFAGTIDEVQVFDRVLTDAEITALYDVLR